MFTNSKRYFLFTLMMSSLTLFMLITYSACNGNGKGNGNQNDMTELDGLLASINSITRLDSTQLEIEYKLQWGKDSDSWVLNPTEPANIFFWNAGGQRVDNDDLYETIIIEDGFLDRSIQTNTVLFTSSIPQDAVEVSVALGNSGLETKRKSIPSL